jgi:hypothetical protein
VTHVYDSGADDFDPDTFVREAVEDGDLVTAATIAIESYGWQLYAFITRQVHQGDVEEVFMRVADEMLRGLPELVERCRVRDWIYTLVHGAWIRTQAGDPKRPLADHPVFARWVLQIVAGYRAAIGRYEVVLVARRRKTVSEGGVAGAGATSGGEPELVVAGRRLASGSGSVVVPLARELHAVTLRPARPGRERIAMAKLR